MFGFVVRIATFGLKIGRHRLAVAGPALDERIDIDIQERPRPSLGDKRDDRNLGYWRSLAQFERRFAHIG